MKEIETKILDINRQEIENKLIKFGAKKIFEGELKAIFFDKENILSDNFEMLRLRQEGDKIKLTHKSYDKNRTKLAKSANETEIEVNDFEKTKFMIEKLGFKKYLGGRKFRISYKLNNVRIEFDNPQDESSFIPEFMELESNNIEDIYNLIVKLGFTKNDCKNWNGLEVKNYYLNKINS